MCVQSVDLSIPETHTDLSFFVTMMHACVSAYFLDGDSWMTLTFFKWRA